MRCQAVEKNKAMTTKEHLTKHDREIAAIRKLIVTGMKMIVKIGGAQKRTDEQLSLLAAEGRATRKELREVAASVRELTNSLKRGSNGSSKPKIDLQ